MSNLSLDDLIGALEELPQDAVVRYGFSSPHSDRGDYSNIAFSPEQNVTIGSMLAHARAALGSTFEGYKGGSYTMHGYVCAYIGEYGECGESITPTHIRMWREETA